MKKLLFVVAAFVLVSCSANKSSEVASESDSISVDSVMVDSLSDSIVVDSIDTIAADTIVK